MIENILNNKTEAIVDYSNFDVSMFGEAAGFGGAMVLIGMATVFAVLCALWGCLVLFKLFFHDLPEKRAKAATVEVAAKEVDIPTAPVSNNDEEIIAVIAAAIAMAESESQGLKFRVVSFKKV